MLSAGMAINYDKKTPSKYLLLGNVLLSLLLFHSEFVVHLLPSFTDIFSFAQLVHMCQTLPGLPFRFYQDVFDLWIVLGGDSNRSKLNVKIAKAMNKTEVILLKIKHQWIFISVL